MTSQTFTLRLRLPEGMASDEAIELLGAADCTDFLVGAGEPGVLALMSDKPSALSAIAELARAIPAAELLSFGPASELSS